MRFEIILSDKELRQLKREQLEKQNKRKRAVKKMYKSIINKIDVCREDINFNKFRLKELSYFLDFESAITRNELIEDIYYLEDCINDLYNDLEDLKRGVI